jgi:hypothetical protein
VALSHPALPYRPRLLRGVAVGVVLLGYLGVLLGTSAGQGWRLLSHVATERHATFDAPRLQSEPLLAPAPGMTTLRTAPGGAHPHGAHTHRHADSGSALPQAGRQVRTDAGARQAPRGETFHAHGGEVHSHDLPPPSEAPAAVHTLDQHRLPLPAAVPAPLVTVASAPGAPAEARYGSASPSVETPPPRG